MAEIDWTNHPKLKNIDEKKLSLLEKYLAKIEKLLAE